MRLKALAEGMLRVAIAVIPLTMGACASGESDDQEAVSCQECRISLYTIHSLSSVGRSAGFSLGVTAARASATGRYAVVPGGRVGRIFLYSPEGEFVREIGSEGEGPGEYGRISAVAFDAADSLYVLDTGNGRIDIYSPDATLARSVRHTERGREMHVLPSGEILVQGAAVGTRYADQGRLWAFGGKPVVPRSVPDPDSFGPGSLELVDMFTDHVMTVLDAETGEVITTQIFDHLPLQFLGAQHAFLTDQLESGEIVLRVVRHDLVIP